MPIIACPVLWAGDLSLEEIQQHLERAAELNVTAPWQESQQVLEEIRPHLDSASEDQRGRFQILSARNQIIAGDMNAGLAMLEDLLATEPRLPIRLRALGLSANAAMLLRRYETSFQYLGQALALLEQSGPDADGNSVFSLAAYIYAQVGQIERATRFGHLAVEHALRSAEQRGICTSHQRLAFVYKVNEDFDNARRHYRQALESCRATNDAVLIGVATYGLADLLRHAGDQIGAAQLFDDAAEILANTGYRTGLAELALYRARLHREREEWSRIESMLPDAALLFKHNEAWDYLAEAHGMLGELTAMRGDYPATLEHFEAQMNARQRFSDMDRARQLAYLEVEFDTQVKEQELALLREQARVRQLEAETRRQQERLRHLGYGIAGFLLIVLVLLLVHATRERRHFRSLARRDGLTGLNNHTHFFEITSPAFDSSRRNGTPFTLVLADIDHFKQVNDQHGHLAGDEVLRRVGARLHEIFGASGEIGRIGGEEFAIALPGWHQAEVRQPLETLRQALRHGRSDDQQIQVSVSFGVAELAGDKTLNELRERADQALYRAKRAGRDRVAYADDAD